MNNILRQTHRLSTAVAAYVLYTLIGTQTGWATTYWISPTGTDSNSCASIGGISDPGRYRKTINAGAACLAAGDILKLKAGTYTGPFTNVLPSGTIMEGDTPGTAVLTAASGVIFLINADRADITIRNLVFDGKSAATTAIRTNSAYVVRRFRVENNIIKNVTDIGIVFGDGATTSLIRNNIIHDIGIQSMLLGRHCIYLRATNSVVENNTCYNSPITGLTVYSTGSGGTGNVIRYNHFRNTGYNTSTDVTAGSGANDRAINISKSNTLVHNNVIVNNTDHGIMVTAGDGIKIYNNTIYGNGGNGIKINSGASNVEVKNNIVVQNGRGNIANLSSSVALEANLTTDPSFVDPARNNFRLKTGSPAIDKGKTIPILSRDADNSAIPNGCCYDIGAYEYVGGTPSTPMSPNGLQAVSR